MTYLPGTRLSPNTNAAEEFDIVRAFIREVSPDAEAIKRVASSNSVVESFNPTLISWLDFCSSLGSPMYTYSKLDAGQLSVESASVVRCKVSLEQVCIVGD